MNKIIKGDQVVVITGKDKGKQGQVVRVLGDKVVVEGVNVVKRTCGYLGNPQARPMVNGRHKEIAARVKHMNGSTSRYEWNNSTCGIYSSNRRG